MTAPPLAARADEAVPARAFLSYSTAGVPMDDPDALHLAHASLLCGIIVCDPFVTGILSVCFAAAVLVRGRAVRTTVRVLAAFGLTTGALNLAFWVAFITGALGD